MVLGGLIPIAPNFTRFIPYQSYVYTTITMYIPFHYNMGLKSGLMKDELISEHNTNANALNKLIITRAQCPIQHWPKLIELPKRTALVQSHMESCTTDPTKLSPLLR